MANENKEDMVQVHRSAIERSTTGVLLHTGACADAETVADHNAP